MTAIKGYPFYTHYYSQDLEVATWPDAKRKLIRTVIKCRITGHILFEYISLDWDQARRWHKKAIEKLININARFPTNRL